MTAIKLTVPAVLSWMVPDIADVDHDEDDSPEWHEMQAACKAVRVIDGKPVNLEMSAEAWVEMLDEMRFLQERDLYPESEAFARKLKRAKAAELKAIEKLEAQI